MRFITQGLQADSDDSDADARKSKKVRFSDAIKAASEAVKVDDRKHPLLTDLDGDDTDTKKKKKADKWFMKVFFSLKVAFSP